MAAQANATLRAWRGGEVLEPAYALMRNGAVAEIVPHLTVGQLWESGIFAVGPFGEVYRPGRGSGHSKVVTGWKQIAAPGLVLSGWAEKPKLVRRAAAALQLGRPECPVIVDAEVVEYLSRWKWRLQLDRRAYRTQEYGGFSFRVKIEWQIMFGPEAERIYGRLSVSPHALCPPSGMVVDHANGNPLDNRRTNLRLATLAQNATNAQRHNPHKKLSLLGVSQVRGGFRGTVRFDCVGHTTPLCATAEAAARARDDLLFSLAGEFGIYNFPRPELGARCRLWQGLLAQK